MIHQLLTNGIELRVLSTVKRLVQSDPMKLFIFLLWFVHCAAENITNCVQDCNCKSQCSYCRPTKHITVLCLKGSHHEMGVHYGQILREQLWDVRAMLRDHYINKIGVEWDRIIDITELFHKRYAHSYESFLDGIVEGSGLSKTDVVVLNGMITIDHYIYGPQYMFKSLGIGGCSFGYVPPNKSTTGKGFAVRNYDFHKPLDAVSRHIAVTTLLEPDKVPTTVVSIAGQIYCPTCVNKNGVFMALNNGMPSGGFYVETERKSLLINMLEYMQNSPTLEHLSKQLGQTLGDYALVINTADGQRAKSFEFSPVLGTKSAYTERETAFASTNFFQNPGWGAMIPYPTDAATWIGVTRREHLLNLLNDTSTRKHDIQSVKASMDATLDEGGARWWETLIQVIYDAGGKTLYVKSPLYDPTWVSVDQTKLYE